ncbi:DUF6252 family protein [Flavobacterium sp.]|uniref:DUF6252 family protein n=1 Tax=Flavobacterium sp. TaxID=239 RepID=UPI00374C986B
MKKISVLFLLFLALGISFTSCTKDFENGLDYSGIDNENVKEPIIEVEPEVKPVVESGKLQVDFDGNTFVSTTVQAIVTNDYISIIALRSPKGDFITLTIPSNKTGTYTWKSVSAGNGIGVLGLSYTLPSDGYSAFISDLGDNDSDFFGQDYKDTASITITSINTTTKKISGTFQFTGGRFHSINKFETKIFTKGSFADITFTPDIPVINDNTFSVKLDGTNFIPTSVIALYSSLGKISNISISGIRDGVETIAIILPGNVKAGTYDIKALGTDYNIMYTKSLNPMDGFSGKSGIITVLSHDIAKKTITGTFNASLWSPLSTETPQVSEGAFSITYK